MKAAVYYQTGGPEVFRYEEVADPTCGPRDVKLDVKAVSIEGGDVLNPNAREEHRNHKPRMCFFEAECRQVEEPHPSHTGCEALPKYWRDRAGEQSRSTASNSTHASDKTKI